MKRIFIPTLFLCLLSLSDAKGQDTLVDKQPQNRAALLEEFTGVNCGYCPAGHVLTNQLMAEHEGRLFVFNLHAPNSNLVTPPSGTADMRTEYGDALATNAGVNTLPLGTVNRHSFNGSLSLGREQWASAIGQVLEMPAYLNVGARATLDWASRELSVEVQLYYTGEAAVEENHIHVALVQNNIQGYQKNGYQNPEQSLGGSLYLHQHIFRDFLTGQWGDAVPAGEAGTFLSRTYSKILPGQIRNVDLDLTELQVIVFVSEDRNEIINACEALIQHENGPGHVFGLSKGTQPQDVFTCDNSIRVAFEFENRNPEGTASAVESVEFLCKSRNREHTFTWQPDSAFGFRQTARVVSDEFPLYLNGVPDTVEVTVAAVNGDAYDFEAQKPLRIPAIKYFGYTSADSVVVDFRQDAYGSESSWVFQTEEGETMAEGGPYKDIAISQAPKQHLHAVPVSLGCYRLIARDSRGDGINNGFGEGSFAISDPDGNILVEHDGIFTDSAVVMLRRSDVGNERADRSGLRLQIVPNPSAGPCRLEVEGWEGTDIRLEIFNAQGKLVAVKQESTGSGTLSIPLPAEELQAGTYLVKLSGPRQNGVAKWVVINRN